MQYNILVRSLGNWLWLACLFLGDCLAIGHAKADVVQDSLCEQHWLLAHNSNLHNKTGAHYAPQLVTESMKCRQMRSWSNWVVEIRWSLLCRKRMIPIQFFCHVDRRNLRVFSRDKCNLESLKNRYAMLCQTSVQILYESAQSYKSPSSTRGYTPLHTIWKKLGMWHADI